ncbi:LysR family transcriptional regulator [Shewanella inventionis]|uniref:LysR family transcriptional regulator n=1 Tax=Shewanella inventionis TaxID=1738770 RepID=A0ABQ1J777_9GAMM|nr:LysR family transcriptional regulator [Shewanella inventionis]
MDIKILKSFISVAAHQSFSAAARELNTVQPAISRHIAMLEDELGVALFIRNSREVAITSAGEQLLHDAKQIIVLADKAKDQVKRAQQGQVGELNIAYLSSACLSFMADLIRSYSQLYPDVHVSLFEMTASEQIAAFNQNRIDVGFSRPLPAGIQDEFISTDIYIDKLVAVVGAHHPLAQYSQISLSQLQQQKMILFHRDEAVGLFDDTIMMCKQAGFSANIVSQPRHMQTLLTEVAAGLGVAIAPYCISKLYSQGCHFLPINDAHKSIPTQLHVKRVNYSAAVDGFVALVIANQPSIAKSMA